MLIDGSAKIVAIPDWISESDEHFRCGTQLLTKSLINDVCVCILYM